MAKEPTAEEKAEIEAEEAFESGAASLEQPAAQPAEPAAAAAKPGAEPPPKPPAPGAAAPAKPAAPPAAAAPAKPAAPEEYVHVTKKDFDELQSAAKKVGTFEQQFSKVFGTIGDMRKILGTLQQGTPRGAPLKVPKEAFAELGKEFPEMAEKLRADFAKLLEGFTGTGPAGAEVDPAKFASMVESSVIKLETEALEDVYPNWRQIVGAIDATKGEKPDPNNAFRKWLGSKEEAYQARINGTNSSAIIARAIRLFQKETKAPTPPPKPPAAPAAAARTRRITSAVRPKGDGGQPGGTKTEDEFEAGYRASSNPT